MVVYVMHSINKNNGVDHGTTVPAKRLVPKVHHQNVTVLVLRRLLRYTVQYTVPVDSFCTVLASVC